MKLFQYARLQSGVHPISQTLVAKWSYLFTDKAVLCTDTGFMMRFRKELEECSMPVRIQFVRDDLKQNAPELLRGIERMLNVYENLTKKKHRSPAEIGAIKKTEHIINDYFKVLIDSIVEPVERTGLHILSDVPDEGLWYYHISTDHPEQDNKGYVAASRILQLLGDGINEDEDKDITFILPFETLMPPYKPEQIFTPEDEQAADEANIWLERIMELPNFNAFNALELQVLRSQMQKGGKAFYTCFDQWIDAAKTGSMNAAGRLAFYKEQIRPAAAALRVAALQNKLLSNMRAATGGRCVMEVWVGEMPLQHIWDFYAAVEITVSETQERLNSPEAVLRGKMRVPVVVLKGMNNDNTENFATTAKDASQMGMPASVRKRIAID